MEKKNVNISKNPLEKEKTEKINKGKIEKTPIDLEKKSVNFNVKLKKKVTKIGTVVSNKKFQEGTLVISVDSKTMHPIYKKQIKKVKRYTVQYNEKSNITLGSTVEISECAPISKTKRFTLTKVIKMNDFVEDLHA